MPNFIWLEFADGSYLAHLKNKRIDEVEVKCGAGLGDIYARTQTGVYMDSDGELTIQPYEAKWKNSELVEVVRQGFIGGGRAIVDGAEKKIETFHVNHLLSSYLDERPRVELWKLAAAILHATMEGYKAPGEAEGVETPPKPKEEPKASSVKMDTQPI